MRQCRYMCTRPPSRSRSRGSGLPVIGGRRGSAAWHARLVARPLDLPATTISDHAGRGSGYGFGRRPGCEALLRHRDTVLGTRRVSGFGSRVEPNVFVCPPLARRRSAPPVRGALDSSDLGAARTSFTRWEGTMTAAPIDRDPQPPRSNARHSPRRRSSAVIVTGSGRRPGSAPGVVAFSSITVAARGGRRMAAVPLRCRRCRDVRTRWPKPVRASTCP